MIRENSQYKTKHWLCDGFAGSQRRKLAFSGTKRFYNLHKSPLKIVDTLKIRGEMILFSLVNDYSLIIL